MRHIILGANGSIGKRHTANLRVLAKGDEIVLVDLVGEADYRHVTEVKWQPDDVAYICTPTKFHWEHLNLAMYHHVRGVFVEKPLFSKDETLTLETDVPIVCGYNYRWHFEYESLLQHLDKIIQLDVIGAENISKQYGDTALETMLSHYLDLALYLFGEPHWTKIVDEGWRASANLKFDLAQVNVLSVIDAMGRNAKAIVTYLSGQIQNLDLTHRTWLDQMYVSEMATWLNFLETGEGGQLCFYEDAMKVQRLMQEANK